MGPINTLYSVDDIDLQNGSLVIAMNGRDILGPCVVIGNGHNTYDPG